MNNRTISYEHIGLTDDFMFCTVMRQEKYCKPFLEMLLGISIRELCYVEKQVAIDVAARAKSIRLDVYANDEKGTVYNIEMQKGIEAHLPMRARYYQSVIDLNLPDKGHRYSELPRSIVIFICNYDPFGENRAVYCYENRLTDDGQKRLEDGTMKVFVNLRGEAKAVSEELKALFRYVNTGETDSAFVESLEEEICRIRSNEKWRREFMTLQELMDERYLQGHAEGRAEERENIKRILQALFAAHREEEIPLIAENFEMYCEEFGID